MDVMDIDICGSVEQDSRLLKLPPEILHCIVTQDVYQNGDRGNLRLVCRVLDDIAKHLVLATLALSSLNLSQLKELASMQSGFEDHATHLRFQGFCASEFKNDGMVYISYAYPQFKFDLEVCRIIRKMKKVTHVALTECPPLRHSRPILETIGMLPLLKDLQLMMMQAGDESLTTATNALSNLTSIRLVTSYSKAPDSTIEKNLSILLAKSPQLSRIHFTVGPPNIGQRRKHYSLESIVTPISTQPDFRPSVRQLNARSLVILPTGPCLAYLGCLTTLCVSTVGQSDNIWPALHASRIMLEDITIDAVTERLLEYLLGYRGLNAFQANGSSEMGWGARNPLPLPDEQQVARLFDQALPHHIQSLKHVGIWFTKDSWGTHSVEKCWVLDAKQLERLGRLSNLEKLAVSVWVDQHGEGVDLAVEEILTYMFTGLSSSLQEVQIRSFTFGHSMHDIQFAVADYEFRRRPSNIHACLITRSPWFIAFDEARKLYKFKTTNEGVLGRLAARPRASTKHLPPASGDLPMHPPDL